MRAALAEREGPLRYPIGVTFVVCCALYSCALTGASNGVTARTTPAMKRRRDITVRPPARRRESSSTEAGATSERRPKHDGQELADQRTLLRRALGGSR